MLDLAAGTGKLTRQLLGTGVDVVAVEPIAEMRAQLEAAVPGAVALPGRAEAIPLGAGAVDAVAVAQAFHWFDGPRALAEIHRVLRPGGALALVWNGRDLDDPLQAAIDAEIRPYRQRAGVEHVLDPRAEIGRSGLFSAVEERRFGLEQELPRDRVADRVASTSVVAGLERGEREELLARIGSLLAARPGPVLLRYVTEVYVADRVSGAMSSSRGR